YSVDVSEVKALLAEVTAAVNPTTSADFFKRGKKLKDQHRYEPALAEFNKALDLDDENLDALVERAWVLNDLKRFAEALADCDAVLEIDPSHFAVLKERGYARMKLKLYAAAIDDLTQVLKRDPK